MNPAVSPRWLHRRAKVLSSADFAASRLVHSVVAESIDHSADDESRAYLNHFVEAVTARESVSTCVTMDKRRTLEALDVEIEKVNDRIAEQPCSE